MSTFYRFDLARNGLLEPFVAGSQGEVHFDEPESTQYGNKVPIRGNTYVYKDDIKTHDWDKTHHEWTGEYWRVDCDSVRVVIHTLCQVCDSVTVAPETVYESDSMTDFEGKIDIDEEGDDTFEFLMGPVSGDERVSRSWAEDAAKTGNYESVEEFAEEFDFEVVSDEELFDEFGDTTADGDGGLVSSGDV
jgi:hypothetical protein